MPSPSSRRFGRQAAFSCQCGQPIYFPNTACLACGAALGYSPEDGQLHTLESASDDTWLIAGHAEISHWKRCANLETAVACNWLEPADSPHELCLSCRLTRTLPDLSIPENGERWRLIELAKRRLVAQLLDLGLPVQGKEEDEQRGLAFDLLGPDAEGNAPLTGHASGLITLNVLEADDDYRERMRDQMQEPYRTLLGHFRHEIGHYYWDRLIADSHWLEPFRGLFGDDRQDYGEALDRHYREGAPPDWPQHFVSAYASMHPWEDWAETWAHYLHMMDTLDTALGFGMAPGNSGLEFLPFGSDVLYRADDPQAEDFLAFVNAWIEMAAMLNELARSMGQPDTYPFALPAAAVTRLHFIHLVVREHGDPPPLDAITEAIENG